MHHITTNQIKNHFLCFKDLSYMYQGYDLDETTLYKNLNYDNYQNQP